MKKNYRNIILPAFFILAVGFVVIKYKDKQQLKNDGVFAFLPRTGNNNNDEWVAAKKNADKLMAKLKADPNDKRAVLALANAYIMEARISGNTAYYDNAAMKTVDKLLQKEPGNYEALMLRSLVQLSQHHFAEGLATAQMAVSIDSNSAFVYGLLIDANVEMGNYEAAVDAADKMVTVRPDLRSYSRIAYLREIHGDHPGAAVAMKLAVQAGVTAEESTEWCRVQLGRLYEHMGDTEKASFQYQLSLAARPGYPYALAGLGRIAAHEKKYDSAVHYYEQAAALINDLGIKEDLVKAYMYAGQVDRSRSLNAALISEMNRSARILINDPAAGHYSDKEMAYACIQNKNYDKALEYAMAEYKRRPKNIEVNETMARVHYKRNEIGKALFYLDAALITKSMNPVLLCTAGLIYAKAGDTGKAKNMLGFGLKHNAVMPEDIKNESREVLKGL
ncbi:MAG TPA: tetratricopeptide repeat protein [Ferruginibacter sp.]|nr:tetratricopeptide repeat protein [Ferruginibacter sp.]